MNYVVYTEYEMQVFREVWVDGPFRTGATARVSPPDDGATQTRSRQAIQPAAHCAESEAAHTPTGGT